MTLQGESEGEVRMNESHEFKGALGLGELARLRGNELLSLDWYLDERLSGWIVEMENERT